MMEPIATIAGIKITENGMIANVNLNNSRFNKIMVELYRLEDKVLMLEFKYTTIVQLIKDLTDYNCLETAKALTNSNKKLFKEIKGLKKTIKNLSKLL